MRAFALAAVLGLVATTAAFADATVAGDWQADIGSNVTITMNVTPDGGWNSETRQDNKVVRQMKGTYRQTASGNDKGTLVFTPTEARVKRGKVTTETDRYQLSDGGNQLALTSHGDTMVFKKQAAH
ncbi:MAG: hypothetical protein ACJ8AW_21890 [Rhodopila sp.]